MIGALGLGLRGKSLLALAIACLCTLIPAGFMGWMVVKEIREDFGEAYARNYNEVNRQRIVVPLGRDLALAQRFADSEVVRRWLHNENDPAAGELFFQEAESYRRGFTDHSWFVVSDLSHHYYFRDEQTAERPAKMVSLDPGHDVDAWYFASIANTETYNINVDPDAHLQTTKVWYNVVVWDHGQKIGLAGSGLDLTRFLNDFILTTEQGTTSMILDRKGGIQAHPNRDLIALNSGSGVATSVHTIFESIAIPAERQILQATMRAAEREPEKVQLTWLHLDGRRQVVADSYIPDLRWHVLTTVDVGAAEILHTAWVIPTAAAFVLLLMLLLFAFGSAVEPLVLRPLHRLQESARAIADGHYDVALPPTGRDEIGELTESFAVMAERVRANTALLEQRVRERTADLEASNQRIVEARRKLDASIDYASVIQRAILPDRQMVQTLGQDHFVLWRPRDVVGGDFYVFQQDGENCLMGVVDCAGHGVPGALMTMLARAAIDHALKQVGPTSPASILAETDKAMRDMTEGGEVPSDIATMDAGLVYIDRAGRTISFAGAKIALYRSDGQIVEEIKGERRALVDRKTADYKDQRLPLRTDSTYYLTTDGFLDQAGGDRGFGFGRSRFIAMLLEHAGLPVREQSAAFAATLARYQGDLPQRDDITVLSFRFDQAV